MRQFRTVIWGAVVTLLLAACQPPAADAVGPAGATPMPTSMPAADPTATPTLAAQPTLPADPTVTPTLTAQPTPTARPKPMGTAVDEPTPTPLASHETMPTPTAVSTPEHFDAPLPTPSSSQDATKHGTGEQSGSCVSNPSPRFTVAHTDLSKIDFIVPMIVPSGNWLKNRSYFRIKDDPATGDGYEVPVYTPIDAVLTSMTRYVESTNDHDGNLLEQDQFDLTFQVSCEVTIVFDHVARLVGAAADVQPTVAVRDTRNAGKSVRVEYKAGDLIGYTKGTSVAHTWDFLMTNTGSTYRYANQERYETVGDLNRLLTAACPYDYYDEPLRSRYLALFGGGGGMMAGAETCLGSPDVPGTVAGGWFESPFSADSGRFVADWALVVVHTVDDRVEVNDGQRLVRTDASHPTHIAPKLVTTEHCYQDYRFPTSFAYLKLLSPDEIAFASGDGTCPSSFPANFGVAYR